MTDLASTSNARIRAERIRLGIHSYVTTRKDIADAYRERDWDTLGYQSWESYVEAEFSEARLRLSPDDRREAVAELRLSGLSQRAIGAALGVDQKTVSNDLRALSTEENSSVQPERITSLDGRERPATRTVPQSPEPKPEPVMPPRSTPDATDPVANVAAALDKYVPDPDAPARAWRGQFHGLLKAPHDFLVRCDADQIAQYAEDQDVETLRLLADSYSILYRRVLAKRGGNITPLRRVK